MRQFTITLAILFSLFAASAIASDAVTAAEKPADALYRTVELPRIAHMPLKRVLKMIASQADLRLSYELDAIERAEISLDMPIDASLPSIPAGEALKLILEPVGLSCVCIGERILIGVQDQPDHWENISYPVADLLNVSGSTTPANDAVELIELIKSTIASPTWESRRAAIKLDAETKNLQISQSREAQEQIAEFLKQLRILQNKGWPRQTLQTKIDLSFQNAPLSKVLQSVSEQCHENIFLTPECGNPNVTLEARNMTGEEAISKLISQLNLRKRFNHQALILAPDTEFVAVIYPVDDLLKSGTSLASIVDRVSHEVMPESWHGGSASIQAFDTNHSLVVTQNEKGHELTKAYLQKLRAKN